MLIPFESIQTQQTELGGKAWGLAMLAQKAFPVPSGLVLDSEPTEAEWAEVLQWWAGQGQRPLAVRSSAGGEDSKETSFAGQNRTFLNVSSEAALRSAVKDCFASLYRDNSKAYRKFFSREAGARMNVVIQRMVAARFAGVFFGEDPVSAGRGWVLEVISGLGEDLVSGKVNPGRIRQQGDVLNLPAGFTAEMGSEVAKLGLAAQKELAFPIDMEWAIDEDGSLHLLQARPITTAAGAKTDYAALELARLKKNHSASTVWDGQTFAEWSGLPSMFTFSIWRRAFSPHHAFGNALRAIGYRSFSDKEWKAGDSLLERVFGRAFVNLERLSDLYYGNIPYRIELRPRPHTRFDFSKLSWRSILHFPEAIFTMLRVGWNLSTKRKTYYQQCLEELSLFKHRFSRPLQSEDISALSDQQLKDRILVEAEEFSTTALHWPLVLVILLEATTQNLRQLAKSILGEEEADRCIREWMGKGLHTITFEMQQEFARACANPGERAGFLARYGHRGPGEMDLSHPRWFELGEQAFAGVGGPKAWQDRSSEVEAEIRAIPSFKREMILEEWRWLKKLLETREAWKMELLRPYAWMRLHVSELGRRLGLGEGIHQLKLEEVLGGEDREALLAKIRGRLEEEKAFRKFSLPESLSLSGLEGILSGNAQELGPQLDGEPLSPGVVYGEVRFVSDPLQENLEEWPENVILAAVSTDPGWTALFAKAKGVVVERGGVLSHCAILSREMGLAAVGGVLGIEKKLKSGDHIWVDGNRGRVTREQY